MYRDTDQGLRYLVKQDGERIVSTGGTTRAKAMAIGTTIDPSYAYPLPILGINYLNFGKDRSSRCCSRACWRWATCRCRTSARARSI
jgi:hypothetical protein